MLYINESYLAVKLLSLCDDRECNCSFSRALGTVDLNYTTSRNTADTESHIECHRACRDSVNVESFTLSEAHYSACPIFLFYLLERSGKSGFLVLLVGNANNSSFFCKFLLSHFKPP